MTEMEINHRLQDVEQSSTVYVHQAEKFHARATHVNINHVIIEKFIIFFIVIIDVRKIFSRS
jgi:hypothetical protein